MAEETNSGTCGENLTWSLDNDGIFTIRGEGDMEDDVSQWFELNISKVIIEEGVTSIGNGAFTGCTGLKDVTLPSSVVSIGTRAFIGCENLTGIHIPEGVTDLGYGAFMYCSRLSAISVAANNSVYSSQDGIVFNKDKTELILCPEGKSGTCTVPDSVTSIADNAFAGCILTDYTIPSSVTSIGWNVFSGNTYYNNKDNWENSALYIGDHLIHVLDAEGVYTIKPGTKTIAGNAFHGNMNMTGVIIPDSVVSIGPEAFSLCYGLKDVVLPDSVVRIDYGAFYSCDSLTSLVIPDGVTSIGDSTFTLCRSLASITIPEKVIQISDLAFGGCDKLLIRGAADSYAEKYAQENGIPFEDVSYILGDLNHSGDVTAQDALVALQASVGKTELSASQRTAADVDGNGKVEATDALMILQLTTQKISFFPANMK